MPCLPHGLPQHAARPSARWRRAAPRRQQAVRVRAALRSGLCCVQESTSVEESACAAVTVCLSMQRGRLRGQHSTKREREREREGGRPLWRTPPPPRLRKTERDRETERQGDREAERQGVQGETWTGGYRERSAPVTRPVWRAWSAANRARTYTHMMRERRRNDTLREGVVGQGERERERGIERESRESTRMVTAMRHCHTNVSLVSLSSLRISLCAADLYLCSGSLSMQWISIYAVDLYLCKGSLSMQQISLSMQWISIYAVDLPDQSIFMHVWHTSSRSHTGEPWPPAPGPALAAGSSLFSLALSLSRSLALSLSLSISLSLLFSLSLSLSLSPPLSLSLSLSLRLSVCLSPRLRVSLSHAAHRDTRSGSRILLPEITVPIRPV
jgi:hypothetical protein